LIFIVQVMLTYFLTEPYVHVFWIWVEINRTFDTDFCI